jgi:predicted DNA-binding transcriptional regulator AlpA
MSAAPLVSLVEAARLLGLDRVAAVKMFNDGRFPVPVRVIDGVPRVSRSAILTYLEERAARRPPQHQGSNDSRLPTPER